MPTPVDYTALKARIRDWATTLGFDALGVAGTDLADDEVKLLNWLSDGRHGDMKYMARHGAKRSRPAELVPNTVRVISVRMSYWPDDAAPAWSVLNDAERAYISRYAVGRDYHKYMRRRLQQLADRIETEVGPFGYRAFVDSAPVLEKPLARNAGLGWVGKHTNVLHHKHGSFFFLGELYTDLPLPPDAALEDHCGRCQACIEACPTGAITAPYQLDARLCISYLTIEHHGPIPTALRPALGNRLYGCDDCQLVCPWNRFKTGTAHDAFAPRHGLDNPTIVDLLRWSEADFDKRTRGSPIRRIGYERWCRNLAVVAGNAPYDETLLATLRAARAGASALVDEHLEWALNQLTEKGRMAEQSHAD
ncbi:MAG: tRNA epoxyqueuosine(34) reductase QueG [Pseudomonadota bacterium]